LLVNGKKVEIKGKKLLIDILEDEGIKIPHLCYDKRVGSSGDCGLCRIKVNGELKLACKEYAAEEDEVITEDDEIVKARLEALENILKAHNGDCISPCRDGCPAHGDVEEYLRLTADGRYHEAVKVMKESYILPAALGRVCPAFCERKCRRSLIDEPLAIRAIKRFAADEDLKDPWMPEITEKKNEKVAVVGAGPAGLSCAYYLRIKGYDVTLLEKMNEVGGMMRYGIPEYRLPRDVLDRDVETVIKTGIHVKTGVALGEAFTIEDLKKDYDAIFIAIGAWESTPMGIGEEEKPFFIHGIEFLRRVKLGEQAGIGRKVIVVGGGNTAIDAARTALRLGSQVTIVYRRSKAEMPANKEEIAEAEEEGIEFIFLANPVDIHNGYVELIRMKLGEPDASGRRKPIPIEGSNFVINADSVILALGQRAEKKLLEKEGIAEKYGRALVDKITLQTDIESVFCGGDLVLGPSTVIESIASGRRAAMMIDLYLRDKLEKVINEIKTPTIEALEDKELRDILYEIKPYNHWRDARAEEYDVEKSERVKPSKREARERIKDFGEIEKTLKREDVEREAKRCLSCGCGKSYDCKLREYATIAGLESNKESIPGKRFESYTNPFFSLDPNKCIACGLCASVCNSVQQCNVISIKDRAEPTKNFEGCVFCGNCLSVCPTGAIVENKREGKGREWELKKTETICPYCGVGCNITLHTKDNRIVRVSSPESSLNEGWLCVKGRFGFDFVNSEERLKKPLIKESGAFREATWDEALSYIALRLKEIIKDYGGNAVGGFSSAKCTNEENYLFQKFMRCVIGTNNVDHCARLCHAPTIAGLAKAFGSGAMTNTIEELENAECIFVIGSNTTETQPITALRIKRAKKAKLIVVDPRKTELAELADLHLQINPGSDVALINGIMSVILKKGLEDRRFIEQRTEGFEALRAHLLSLDLEDATRITGVKREDIEKAAELYASAKHSSIVYCMGITQHISGTENVLALADLAMLCGMVGKESTGVNPLRGQCNVQGACDMGALPEFFTGYQKIDDEKAVEKFEAAWGRRLPRTRGLSIEEIIQGAEAGEIKALYVMGENPVLSDPDSEKTVKALKKLDLLVVQDIFLTETAEIADVVLPAACFAEKDGTFTNTERRVQRLRKAIEPPGEAREDWRIICELSSRMGYQMSYKDAAEVMQEIASLTPIYTGISYERITTKGLQWPCPSKEHPGTKYLHKDEFSRGKGRFYCVNYRAPAEHTDEDYPFILSTGRVLYHFHTGTMSRKSRGINEVFPGAIVEISPEDAARLSIGEGDRIRITSRRGSVVASARITERVKEGMVFMPFHFREAPANRLTSDVLDEEAKIPEYKISAVRIEKCY